MKPEIAVAWVLGVTGVAMFTTGLILTLARKSESVPFGDGGGETLESFDPSKGSGRVVKTDKLTSARLQWPKTYTAPDGVNTITEHGDGTGSMTLLWVPQEPKPSEYDRGYAAGVNAALDSIALHDLERQMHATLGTPEQKKAALTPMTWGERGELVAKRLGVVRSK